MSTIRCGTYKPFDNRHEDVEHDDERNGPPAEQRQQQGACCEEPVAQAVAAPAEPVELEGEHSQVGDHEPRGHKGRGNDHLAGDRHAVGLGQHAERGTKHRGGRDGQSEELGALRVIDVEPGQAKRSAGREEKDDEPRLTVGQPHAGHLPVEGEHHGRGGESERNIVGQRVELQADRRGLVQQTRHKTVEEIENGGQNDQPEGQRQLAPHQCRHGRHRTAQEVGERQQVGYREQFDLHSRTKINRSNRRQSY